MSELASRDKVEAHRVTAAKAEAYMGKVVLEEGHGIGAQRRLAYELEVAKARIKELEGREG